jgi:hypothetical protein
VIESFVQSLGLAAQPAMDGSYNFVFERLGSLSVVPTEREQGTIIALSRPARTPGMDVERRLLAAGGVDRATNRLIYTAIGADGSHIIAVDFDESHWSLPNFDETLRFLIGVHESI